MTDHAPNFIKRLSGITLSSNERLQMRERLAAYADMHAVAVPAYQPSSFGSFFAFIGSRRFSTYAMGILMLAVAGSGVTLAADASVPGDSLYQVKIHVNEPLMTALAASPAGQAKVAADIATRRADEAVTLASRNELTAERQTYLAQAFDEGVKAAAAKADHLAMLDSSAAAGVRADLAANLAGEAQALGAVNATHKGDAKELLTAIVSTSESISDSSSSGIALADEATSTQGAEATATEPVAPPGAAVRTMATARIAAKASTTASTTPGVRAFVTGRFTKNLRISSTTLRNFTASTLNTASLLAPRLDVAIPSIPVPVHPASVTETGSDSSFETTLGD